MFMCNHSGSSPADSTFQHGQSSRFSKQALAGTSKPSLELNRRQTRQSLGERACLLLGLLLLLLSSVATADPKPLSPNLGRALAAEEIAAFNLTILPNGQGLPVGKGSVSAGKAVYLRECMACHGEEGKGGLNNRLAGGVGSIQSASPDVTVGSYWPEATTLFDYIRRAMPYTDSGRLTVDETYAVTAYVLFLSGIVEDHAVVGHENLADVAMPNKAGFYWAEAPK